MAGDAVLLKEVFKRLRSMNTVGKANDEKQWN